MFCQKCGKEIPDGSAFCANCGTRAGESGTPQVTYIVKEAKPKPILTGGEKALITVIGILKIVRFSLMMILFLIGGTTASSVLGYDIRVIQALQSIMLLVILFLGVFIFFGVMVLLKKRWALIIFDVVQILGMVISVILILTGNLLSVVDLIIHIVMVILIHKSIKALSWEVQEARRTAQQRVSKIGSDRTDGLY
ncbi:MAG: zinc ribbon domain-containing protein [Bacteroides sp.]|nr:zinc ribbon domain-containing protein [Eubacterium sp.]MCM1418738.1 zinc ribbon domain-containing protein [Roseburia sp.]MCM1462806.1 zinc ribbon domain-containing protein [Bacteroides sp.]